jgi:hypothetical protein
MFNNLSHKGNANQNNPGIPPHHIVDSQESKQQQMLMKMQRRVI